jgi:hypothetical protein
MCPTSGNAKSHQLAYLFKVISNIVIIPGSKRTIVKGLELDLRILKNSPLKERVCCDGSYFSGHGSSTLSSSKVSLQI